MEDNITKCDFCRFYRATLEFFYTIRSFQTLSCAILRMAVKLLVIQNNSSWWSETGVNRVVPWSASVAPEPFECATGSLLWKQMHGCGLCTLDFAWNASRFLSNCLNSAGTKETFVEYSAQNRIWLRIRLSLFAPAPRWFLCFQIWFNADCHTSQRVFASIELLIKM